MLQKLSFYFHRNCQITFSTIQIVSWGFFPIKLQKNRPIPFLHWRACLFLLEILCFQQHLRSWRIDHVTCKMFVKTTCGRLNVVACCLSYSIKRGKRVTSFFTAKIVFFFESLCFQQPFRCYRNDLLTSRVIVGRLFGPSKIVLWAFLNSMIRKNAKIFFLRNIAFFTNWCCINLLGPIETNS